MSASKQAVRVELSRIWGSVPLLAALNADGKREIGLALLRHCQSDAHVAAVVETFLETVLEWRNPIAELVRIAHDTEDHGAAPAGCDRCRLGEDVDTGEMRWAPHVNVTIGPYDYAARCPGPEDGPPCPRGAWLWARDAEGRPKHTERRAGGLERADGKMAAAGVEE